MRYADAHADTFYRITLEGLDPREREGGLHVNLPRANDVGQVLQVCSVFTPKRYSDKPAEDFARRIIATLDDWAERHPDKFVRIRTRTELEKLGRGALGVIPWLEGASPVRGELSLVDQFFKLGVRGIGLVHNHANEVADGCGVEEPRNGLTDFGRKLIARMEELGMAVDCAHLPQPAFDHVMGAVERPPCISHVGCKALKGITRNADDAMLRGIGDRGGFVGIDFYPDHLVENAFDENTRNATTEDIADHIIHAASVCGWEHVGLGGDFDGFGDACDDLQHLGDMPNLEQSLRRKGVSESNIEKVFSTNLLSYLSKVLPS